MGVRGDVFPALPREGRLRGEGTEPLAVSDSYLAADG